MLDEELEEWLNEERKQRRRSRRRLYWCHDDAKAGVAVCGRVLCVKRINIGLCMMT